MIWTLGTIYRCQGVNFDRVSDEVLARIQVEIRKIDFKAMYPLLNQHGLLPRDQRGYLADDNCNDRLYAELRTSTDMDRLWKLKQCLYNCEKNSETHAQIAVNIDNVMQTVITEMENTDIGTTVPDDYTDLCTLLLLLLVLK